jgi:hypothetical protein
MKISNCGILTSLEMSTGLCSCHRRTSSFVVLETRKTNYLCLYCLIVKRVSRFKSSLLLRIQIEYTHELQFLIKTKDSIFNRKIYTTDERRKPSIAWLGFLRQTILIKEKHQHLSKTTDRVSRNVFGAQALVV